MLPNGATPSEFALRYSQHLKTFVDKIQEKSQYNARSNYQGKRNNHCVLFDYVLIYILYLVLTCLHFLI